MIDRFFDTIYENSDGYANLTDETIGFGVWFHWPEQRNELLEYVRANANKTLYCSTTLYKYAPYNGKPSRRIAANASVGWCVYADADEVTPAMVTHKPTIAVQSSRGRWHLWWRLNKETDAAELARVSTAVGHGHHMESSSGIVTKLLRVPGTVNYKHSVPWTVTAEFSDEVYDLDNFYSRYVIDPEETVAEPSERPIPEDLPPLASLLPELPAHLQGLYTNEPPIGSSWSERMWRLIMELYRFGFGTPEVFVLCRSARCNKYDPNNAGKQTQTGVAIPVRQNPDETLWKEVLKAEAEFNASELYSPEALEYADEEIPVLEEVYDIDKARKPQFLTDAEREAISEPGFIERYTAWVASMSDSAPTYQKSMACMLLSCVFGDQFYIPTKFEKMRLNLWVYILGDTTRTRKSTAKNKLWDLIEMWEEAASKSIDLANSFTPESMNESLSQRDHQVSIVGIDEIQSFFKEVFVKQYMTGATGRLAELYDGKTQKVLRRGSGSIDTRADVVFNFVGVGIEEQTAGTLSKDDFSSGFLARVLWSIADPPPLSREHEEVEMDDGFMNSEAWNEAQRIINGLAVRYKKYHYMPKDRTGYRPVSFEQSALKRFNDWRWETTEVLQHHPDSKILEPARQRLSNSVLKTAALLALEAGQTEVTTEYVLRALQQAELWFSDMIRMVEGVARSDFEKAVDDLCKYIASGNRGRTLQEIHRHTKARPAITREYLELLQQQGRIRMEDKRYVVTIAGNL